MDELMDLIIADESPSEVSDAIKNVLFAKAAERIEYAKPYVADSMFGLTDEEEYDEDLGEIDSEYDTEEDE
jgi:hypothetical protein